LNGAAQGLTPFNILGGLQESTELLQLLLDDPAGVPTFARCACVSLFSACNSAETCARWSV